MTPALKRYSGPAPMAGDLRGRERFGSESIICFDATIIGSLPVTKRMTSRLNMTITDNALPLSRSKNCGDTTGI